MRNIDGDGRVGEPHKSDGSQKCEEDKAGLVMGWQTNNHQLMRRLGFWQNDIIWFRPPGDVAEQKDHLFFAVSVPSSSGLKTLY